VYSKSRKFLKRFRSLALYENLSTKVKYIMDNHDEYFRKPFLGKVAADMVRWQVSLTHKVIDDVNLGAIMNRREIRECVPGGLRIGRNPEVRFKFSKTLASKVLNYNATLKDVGTVSYGDILGMTCKCDRSRFRKGQLGHVITGDLGLIVDYDLRLAFSKGTKFRETSFLDSVEIKRQVRTDIESGLEKSDRKDQIQLMAGEDG
jgi:hypothetical protein